MKRTSPFVLSEVEARAKTILAPNAPFDYAQGERSAGV